MAGLCRAIKGRRGEIVDDVVVEGTPIHNLKATMPVATSFGFSSELRSVTAGRAFPQLAFSHWAQLPADPLDPNSPASKIVCEIRGRKRMPTAVPALDTFMDTL